MQKWLDIGNYIEAAGAELTSYIQYCVKTTVPPSENIAELL